MIKRQYFIKTEVNNGGIVTHSYRQYWYKSWLSRPADALNDRLAIMAADLGVDVEVIIVTAFNRV